MPSCLLSTLHLVLASCIIMVAIKTLLPKELPSLRVLAITLFTWSWMMTWLTVSFAVLCCGWPVLHILPLSAGRRSYWQGFLFRAASSPFMNLHPLWSQEVVHGRPPITWAEWWQQQVLRDGISGKQGQSIDRLPRRLLICSNHVSDLDPFCTNSALLPLECKYIAKSSLFDIPIGGWCMRMSGDIAVHFTIGERRLGHQEGQHPTHVR